MSVAETELRRKQIEQAEELLFSGPQKAGFAKDLQFFGRFLVGIDLSVSGAARPSSVEPQRGGP